MIVQSTEDCVPVLPSTARRKAQSLSLSLKKLGWRVYAPNGSSTCGWWRPISSSWPESPG